MFLLTALALGTLACGSSSSGTSSSPPGGVHICEHAYAGPFTGYPVHCEADIGSGPIRPPVRLWCITTLKGVKGKLIFVQVFYGASLLPGASGELFSRHGESTVYAEITPSDLDLGPPRKRLPIGRYRCRFSADSEVHARMFRVA